MSAISFANDICQSWLRYFLSSAYVCLFKHAYFLTKNLLKRVESLLHIYWNSIIQSSLYFWSRLDCLNADCWSFKSIQLDPFFSHALNFFATQLFSSQWMIFIAKCAANPNSNIQLLMTLPLYFITTFYYNATSKIKINY